MAAADDRRVLAGGNLGRPALDLLDEATPDLYVLELSSFQLETTRSLAPAAAAVLNLSADHLDRYASLADYARAKRRIFERAAIQIVNADDPMVAAMRRADAPALTFSTRETTADFGLLQAGGKTHLARRGERLLDFAALKIKGLHNAANALAALALGEAAGLRLPAMLAALTAFPGLPHRSEWVADRGGVSFIDDSKGTNVGATVAAVAGMDGPLVLIAGGEGKGQDFTPLAAGLRGKIRAAVLIGKDAAAIARVLDGVCPVSRADTMAEAVALAARAARPGDAVLLSPACASLDMFRDYAHRGAEFAAAVHGLAGKPT
jgi:UDP-N-acetylmuramoylalanine--D-glutamate ligase